MNNEQIASQTVAQMIEDAKNILVAAKVIADEHEIGFCLHDLYEEVTDEYVDWYSSNC